MNTCWNGQPTTTTTTVFPKIWEQVKIASENVRVKFKESQGSHNNNYKLWTFFKKCGTEWKLHEKISNGKPTKMELCFFLLLTESTFHWRAVTKLLKI